jgi:hypothetical protein
VADKALGEEPMFWVVKARGLALAGCAFAAAGFASPALGSSRAQAPKITAHPKSVMIRSSTTLTGRGFPANASIELRECGTAFWLAPAEPCSTGNAITVQADAKGRFTTSFDVELCPDGHAGKHPTERICFIGEPQSEEDTTTLVGAAKVRVSYP